MAVPDLSSPDDEPESDKPFGMPVAGSPYQELQELRAYGPIQYAWLIGQIIEVASIEGFPSPAGPYWTRASAADWLHERMAGTRGVEFIVGAFGKVLDDKSYRLYARRSIKNALIDEAIATPVGRLRKRMKGLLADEPGFVEYTETYGGTHSWTVDGIDGIWQGDWRDLLRAPGLRALGTIRNLNPSGPTSRENKAKLVGAARLFIEHAAGALTAQVLATLLVVLFDLEEDLGALGFDDLAVEPSEEDRKLLEVESRIDREHGWALPGEYLAPVDALAAQEEADEILSVFTREEKIAIALADHPAETLGEVLKGLSNPAAFQKVAIKKFVQRCNDMSASEAARKIAVSRCSAELDE